MDKYKEIEGKSYLIADPTKLTNDENVCFLINKKYYRLKSGSVVYDYNLKRYVLKSEIQVENGIVGIDENDLPILGSWSWPQNFNMADIVIAHYKNQSFYCISDEIFEGTGWAERVLNGEFYHKKDLPVKEFYEIKSVSQDIKNSYPYNSSESIKTFKKRYDENFKVSEYNKGISNYPQVLGKYTYGIEFETSKGFVPDRIFNKLGLIPLRDGSIDGIEYATIPLKGKDGIQTIIDICSELKKRTSFNKDCSLHIHIGGMPRKESYFIALTKVLCNIQEEMYSLFPFYTRGGFNLKKKDYTAPLPAVELMSKIDNYIDVKDKNKLNENFNHVFQFLSMGHNYQDYNNNLKNVVSHPSDPSGTSKWYVKSRYKWVNLIPLLFGNKKTIEFRIHTPTYDPNKIMYFCIICAAIVDFAERNSKRILEGGIGISYNLYDIIYSYLSQYGDKYSQVHDYIYRYCQDRKRYYDKCLLNGDFYGNEDEFINKFKIYEIKDESYDIASSLDGYFKSIKKGFSDRQRTTIPPQTNPFGTQRRRIPNLDIDVEDTNLTRSPDPRSFEDRLREAMARGTVINEEDRGTVVQSIGRDRSVLREEVQPQRAIEANELS